MCVGTATIQAQKTSTTGSWDGTCRIWNSETGAHIRTIQAGTHAITLCLLPDGNIATGSQEAVIKIFRNNGGKSTSRIRARAGNGHARYAPQKARLKRQKNSCTDPAGVF